MDAHHLSQRLLCVADLIEKGARLADIGSDHAYLPAYLALKGQIEFGIAGEVVKGPYENAKQEIKKEGLEDKVQARLADGLNAIELADQINVITICGMGGTLICDILEAGKDNNYQITAEYIMEEDGHIYEVIAASYTDEKQTLTQEELQFGPYLLQKKNAAFQAKWQKEIAKLETILKELNKANQVPVAKKQALEAKIAQIGSVLNG